MQMQICDIGCTGSVDGIWQWQKSLYGHTFYWQTVRVQVSF